MAIATPLTMIRDTSGAVTFGLQFSDNKYSATISGAATTLTIPFGAPRWLAIFNIEAGTRVWVALNATATIPAGGTFASTNSSLNPAPRQVYPGDVLSFITPDASADIGVELYAIL